MFWYSFLKWTVRVVFFLPICLDIKRYDDQTYKGKIFVSNHPSTLDPLFVIAALDESVSTLITNGVFVFPIAGRVLRAAKQIPVIDGKGNLAYKNALGRLQHGENILIFPEGKLSNEDGKMSKAFSGAARLALEAKAPLIPIGISLNKRHVLHKNIYINSQLEKARFYLLGRYNITIGRAIKGNKNSSIANLKARLISSINTYTAESKKRILSA